MPLPPRLPDLASLDALVSVARLGSMGAAAREQGLSQQAVSARVRLAERVLGVRVFERSAAGVRPTAEGALVLEWATAVLDAARALGTGAEALRGRLDANLRVAASMTVAEHLVPSWTVALHHRRPDVVTSVRVLPTTEVEAAVRAGTVDLGFVEGPEPPFDLRWVPVARDELVVVVTPDHPWAHRPSVTRAELAATPLVQREPGTGTRITYEQAVEGAVEPAIELASSTALKAAAIDSGSPAVLSSLAVEAELADGRLVRVPVEGMRMTRRLLAVWDAAHGLSASGRELLDIARAAPPVRSRHDRP